MIIHFRLSNTYYFSNRPCTSERVLYGTGTYKFILNFFFLIYLTSFSNKTNSSHSTNQNLISFFFVLKNFYFFHRPGASECVLDGACHAGHVRRVRLLLVRPVRTQRKEVPRTGQGWDEGPMLPGHGHLRTRAALRRKNTRLTIKKMKKFIVCRDKVNRF